jgi:hypothetical protein
MHKNAHLNLLAGNPKLPGKRPEPSENSPGGGQPGPLSALLRWCRQLLWQGHKAAADPTEAEKLEIEAWVTNELYPKRVKK